MASSRRGHSAPDKDPVRYSDNWVVGTVTRKLHGCMIVNHDVFIHKSAYVGVYDTKEWFACLQENDAVEFIAEEHIESKNRWRALFVRDPPPGYRRAGSAHENCMAYGPPPAAVDPRMLMMPPMDHSVPHPPAFYGPPPPMMMPPMYFSPMFVPSVPGPFPLQAGYPVPSPHLYPPAPMPVSSPNPNSPDVAVFPPSPPSPSLQPNLSNPGLEAPSPSSAGLSPSPTPVRYVPAKGDVKNTPPDVTRETDDEDDLTSNASLSSHSTDRAVSPVEPCLEPPRLDTYGDADIKEADVQLFIAFLSSGDVKIAQQDLMGRSKASPDFLTTVLSLILEPRYATADNIAKVKELFLHFASTGLFDFVHFQVAWIVAAYRIAHGYSIDNQVAVDLLGHALAHGYLQMDALRLIIPPLRSTQRAVSTVLAALANVLAARDEAFLMRLYHSSTIKLMDLDAHVTETELRSCAERYGVDFLLKPLKAIDALNSGIADLTITA